MLCEFVGLLLFAFAFLLKVQTEMSLTWDIVCVSIFSFWSSWNFFAFFFQTIPNQTKSVLNTWRLRNSNDITNERYAYWISYIHRRKPTQEHRMISNIHNVFCNSWDEKKKKMEENRKIIKENISVSCFSLHFLI